MVGSIRPLATPAEFRAQPFLRRAAHVRHHWLIKVALTAMQSTDGSSLVSPVSMCAGEAGEAERGALLKALLWRSQAGALRRLLLWHTSWLPPIPGEGDAASSGRVSGSASGVVTAGGLLWRKCEIGLSHSEVLRRKQVRLSSLLASLLISATESSAR